MLTQGTPSCSIILFATVVFPDALPPHKPVVPCGNFHIYKYFVAFSNHNKKLLHGWFCESQDESNPAL